MTTPARNTIAPIGKRFSLNDSGWLELFSRWYIWLSLAAIVFGALALMASNGIRIYSKRVGLAQAQEIALAGRQAAIADEGAAKANARAAQLEVEAKKSGELIADANARASEANARAKEAEAQVAQANAASRDAVAKVAAAEARIAEANRAAAEANRVAESERLARLQLETRLAPRTLTDEQQKRLVNSLSVFHGITVDFVVFGDSYEIQTIGNTLISCLQKAGWSLNPKMAMGGAGSTRGIPIGVRADADSNSKQAAATLIIGLQSAGIASGPWDFDQMQMPSTFLGSGTPPGGPTAPIRVFIGAKP